MPIWLELLVLCWLAYGIGLAIGWVAWGDGNANVEEERK